MSSLSHNKDHLHLPALIIAFEDEKYEVTPEETCTFGRAGDIEIDSANRLLHRVLGRFFAQDGQWWITNEGRSIALVMTDVDTASYTRVVAGTSLPLPFRSASVSFTAGRANYRIGVQNGAIDVEPFLADGGELPIADATLTTGTLVFNEEQFELLQALAQPRLDGPISAADLPSNREFAQQLGWTPSKFNRKLDNLCTKLTRAGIVGLQGSLSEVATDRRVQLANFVVEHGIVVTRSNG